MAYSIRVLSYGLFHTISFIWLILYEFFYMVCSTLFFHTIFPYDFSIQFLSYRLSVRFIPYGLFHTILPHDFFQYFSFHTKAEAAERIFTRMISFAALFLHTIPLYDLFCMQAEVEERNFIRMISFNVIWSLCNLFRRRSIPSVVSPVYYSFH